MFIANNAGNASDGAIFPFPISTPIKVPITWATTAEVLEEDEEKENKRQFRYSSDKKISETLAGEENKSLITRIGMGAGKVINTFYQASRDAIQTMINTILPFMGFV